MGGRRNSEAFLERLWKQFPDGFGVSRAMFEILERTRRALNLPRRNGKVETGHYEKKDLGVTNLFFEGDRVIPRQCGKQAH